jgi:hypothetical protein
MRERKKSYPEWLNPAGANKVLLGMSALCINFVDRRIMNGGIAARVVAARLAGYRRAALGLLVAGGLLLLGSGCVTTSKKRPLPPAIAPPRVVPPSATGGEPVRPVTIPQAPAMPTLPTPAPPAPAAGVPAVGPEMGVTKLTMLVESEPAGATIVVDGRPVGKTPLRLGVPATVLGFFRDYVEIRARFIAENETEVSQTATEEFSPREKVPAVLHFTPAGVRRTVRE